MLTLKLIVIRYLLAEDIFQFCLLDLFIMMANQTELD